MPVKMWSKSFLSFNDISKIIILITESRKKCPINVAFVYFSIIFLKAFNFSSFRVNIIITFESRKNGR